MASLAASIFEQPFVQGRWQSPVGEIPLISSQLTLADELGAIKVRLGIKRMDYAVVPGVYALGRPDENSPVLVTANYKLSLDRLRQELGGLDVWILSLDTNGINVWCAAGKRTFASDTLVKAVLDTKLAQLVAHRELILPQLGAPGVAAHLVKRQTGFKVLYGPVRAEHIKEYLAAGKKAAPAMRRPRFNLADRAALTPMELIPALQYGLPVALALFLAAGLGSRGFWPGVWSQGIPWAAAALLGVLGGTMLGPMLLPWLPGRAFSLKGLLFGLALAALGQLIWPGLSPDAWGRILLLVSLTSFGLMNFTGSSTYTGLSGVKKEMRRAVPLQILGGLGALALFVLARLGWGGGL